MQAERDAEKYGYKSEEINGTLYCFIPQTKEEYEKQQRLLADPIARMEYWNRA